MKRAGEDLPVVQERDAVAVRRVLATAIVALGIGVLAVVVSFVMLPRQAPAAVPAPAPDEIGLVRQTTIGDDDHGLRLRREQERKLQAYGWVDRDAGIAHVPIGRAVTLLRARLREADGGAP
jgi:hypothetical protein